jgi:hypothetical protein
MRIAKAKEKARKKGRTKRRTAALLRRQRTTTPVQLTTQALSQLQKAGILQRLLRSRVRAR